MPDFNATLTSGVAAKGYREGPNSTDPWAQAVYVKEDRIVSFSGRTATYVTPGRGVAAQKVFAIHNASASPVVVSVDRLTIDLLTTVAKAATVLSPIIRVSRLTNLPTGGTSLFKVPMDTALTSNAAVTVWGDSSADNAGAGTSSATTLTLSAGIAIAQKYTPRLLTAVGYEPIDTAPFFHGEPDITLRALEGVCVHLDMATVTTGNPATDKWLVTCDWTEFTRP
jgi:hypothetical protein